MTIKYKETEKPLVFDKKSNLYYMYSNCHDILGESYKKITTQEELDIAYKIYIKENK